MNEKQAVSNTSSGGCKGAAASFLVFTKCLMFYCLQHSRLDS
jgi:hypothetical protein